MGDNCKIAGTLLCRCGFVRPFAENETDLRVILMKLFTDHAVYTVFVIRGMIDGSPDVSIQTNRLLANQVEIGQNLVSYTGKENGQTLGNLLTEHIKLAAATVKAAISGNTTAIEVAKRNLFANSDDVATTINVVTNGKLPLEQSKQMWRIHNELVIEMVVHRLSKEYELEQVTYDTYFNEIMAMVKAIYLSLM